MRIVRDPAHAIRPGGSWASPRRKRASIMSEDGSTLLWKFAEKSDNVQQQPTEADATKTNENSPWKVDWNLDGTNGDNGGNGSKGGNTVWDTSEWDAGSGGWESFTKDTPDGSLKTNGLQNTRTSGGSASVAQLSSFFDSVDARDDSTLPTAWADLKASDADTSTWSTFPGGNTQQRSQNEGASINIAARNRPVCQSTGSGFEKQWLAADMRTKDAAGTTTTRVERNKDATLEKTATTPTGEPTRPTHTTVEHGKDIRLDTETSNRSIRAKKETSEVTREQREAENAIDIVKGATDVPTDTTSKPTNPFDDELLNDSLKQDMPTNTTSKPTNPFDDELLNDSLEQDMPTNTTSKPTNPFDDELLNDSFERDITNTNSKSTNPFENNEHLDGSLERDMPTNTTSKSTNPFDDNERLDGSLERNMPTNTTSKSTNLFDDNEHLDGSLEREITNTTSKSTNPFDNNERLDDALEQDMTNTTSKSTNPFGDELSDDSLEEVMVGTLRSRRHNKNSANKKSTDAKQKQSLPSESESITYQSTKMCESMPPKAMADNKPQRDGRSPPASPARSVNRRKALKQLKEET